MCSRTPLHFYVASHFWKTHPVGVQTGLMTVVEVKTGTGEKVSIRFLQAARATGACTFGRKEVTETTYFDRDSSWCQLVENREAILVIKASPRENKLAWRYITVWEKYLHMVFGQSQYADYSQLHRHQSMLGRTGENLDV